MYRFYLSLLVCAIILPSFAEWRIKFVEGETAERVLREVDELRKKEGADLIQVVDGVDGDRAIREAMEKSVPGQEPEIIEIVKE